MNHRKTVRRSIEYIEEHLNEKLSPDIIAAEAGYSVSYFSRIFKEYSGKSVMRFVRDLRLEQAREEADENRVCELAEKCGYGTASGFSRAYKRAFGENPSGRMNA